MYNVLIVDDEKYVRLWIKSCIDWHQYGFNIMDEASNGSVALIKIRELRPDLIISDMDMPDVNGVELIKKTNEMYPEVLFVILSGYNEFEFMRSAVKGNAVDYLLKPIKAEEIISVLSVVKNKLDCAAKKKEEELRSKIVVRENLNFKKEKFLESLLDEQVFNSQEVWKKAEKLGFEKNGDSYAVLCASIEEAENGSAKKDVELDLCKFSMMNIINEVFASIDITSHCLSRKDEIVCVINFYKQEEDFYQRIGGICKIILNNINHYLQINVSIGIGSQVEDIPYIGASYKEAKKSLELRLIYGSNSILTLLNAPKTLNKDILKTIDESSFINSLITLNTETSEKMIVEIFDRLKESDFNNIETIKSCYYRLISIILKAMAVTGIAPSYMELDEVEMFTVIKSVNSIDKIKEKLQYYLNKAAECISDTYSIKNTAVEKAKKFIFGNLKEGLSLTDISNHVHITPNYFCTLFKSETNQNLFDYITELRIEKAKSFMKDESLKTYEIGEMVGYKESKYFCRVFKKTTGLSPSNYRKTLIG